MKNFDIYQMVTDRIIAELEKGIIPWKKPWKVAGARIETLADLKKVAFNRITLTAYSALNQMLLSKAGEYASFLQWQKLGGKVKKGAKSEIVVFWKLEEYKTTDENGEEKLVKVPILKYYNVFHIDDIDGVQPLTLKETSKAKQKFSNVEQAEQIIETYSERENCKISYQGNEAYYRPSTDEIVIPDRFKFAQRAELYSTIFHEITHSTGAKQRLDRLDKFSFFGSESYSKEELVAEIGASGMCSLLDIETSSSFKNSTAYIQSWLQQLRNDKKLIVSASSKAEKAIDYILNGKTQEIQQAV